MVVKQREKISLEAVGIDVIKNLFGIRWVNITFTFNFAINIHGYCSEQIVTINLLQHNIFLSGNTFHITEALFLNKKGEFVLRLLLCSNNFLHTIL